MSEKIIISPLTNRSLCFKPGTLLKTKEGKTCYYIFLESGRFYYQGGNKWSVEYPKAVPAIDLNSKLKVKIFNIFERDVLYEP